jgi:hypothetical protein
MEGHGNGSSKRVGQRRGVEEGRVVRVSRIGERERAVEIVGERGGGRHLSHREKRWKQVHSLSSQMESRLRPRFTRQSVGSAPYKWKYAPLGWHSPPFSLPLQMSSSQVDLSLHHHPSQYASNSLSLAPHLTADQSSSPRTTQSHASRCPPRSRHGRPSSQSRSRPPDLARTPCRRPLCHRLFTDSRVHPWPLIALVSPLLSHTNSPVRPTP